MIVAIAISLIMYALTCIVWATHVNSKNFEIARLRYRNVSLTEELEAHETRKAQEESIPLRTTCRCGHDAYQHGHNGCNNWRFLRGDCDCLATQKQVLYDPEPMRKMTPL